MPPQKILIVYGTRPEAIKMAPVVRAVRARPERFRAMVVATGQHREMLDQVQRLFGLEPDVDLDLMRPGQQLNDLAARALAGLEPLLERERPDWVLVQGDTTTAMTAALAAFHRRIPVGHVEAGLRTGDLERPFPEEANRRIIDLLATACFAPTERARRALVAEGLAPGRIHRTGNTVVDALREVRERLAEVGVGPAEDDDEVLVTAHRRESFGRPLARVLDAVSELAGRFPQLRFVYPVHPNPHVEGPAHERLGGLPNVELHPPLDYRELVGRLARCRLVLTDSGGIQEEAPSFGKPVLVLRETTERPEGVEAGVARLVGTDRERIVTEASLLLTDGDAYARMANAVNPYGDGRAGERIAAILAGESWSEPA